MCPLPGLVLHPSEGVVPSGGQAALQIHFNPDSVIKFDTRVEVREREKRRGRSLYFHIMVIRLHVCVSNKERNCMCYR